MKTDFLMLFILAHLSGDFVFQTDKIARLKAANVKGLLVHVLIVTAVQVIFLSIFGINGIFAGLICGFIHFFIDYSKNLVNKYLKKQFLYFVFDQMLHIGVILAITFILGTKSAVLGLNVMHLQALISLIILTYVTTVAVKILLADLNMTMRNGGLFEKHERILDCAILLILFGCWTLSNLIGIIATILLFFAFRKIQRNHFKYNLNIYLIKYAVYVLITMITARL